MTPTNPAKITLHNIKKYIQGTWRYFIFKYFTKDGKDLKMLPAHQIEQFKWRLTVMNPQCLENKQCVICGCDTPALQMCGEACEGGCYPPMMTEEKWADYKTKNQIII